MVKARINYIDALRGFTMFVVVFVHVLNFLFGMLDSFLCQLFVTFMMPMFFFISGYLAYKPVEKFSFDTYAQMTRKKAVSLLVPATLFWCIFVVYLCKGDRSPIEYIAEKGFVTYWFLYALMGHFVVYYSMALMANYNKIVKNFLDAILIFVAVVGVVIYLLFNNRASCESLRVFAFFDFCFYFQFFVLGIFAKRHHRLWEKSLHNDKFITAVIIVFVACLFVIFHPRVSQYVPAVVAKVCVHEVVKYAGVLIVFAYFRRNAEFFNAENNWVKSILFVGRRTLDVYLIHFFFLSFSMDALCFGTINLFVIQFFITVLLATLVMATSLGVGSIIRMSGFLARYLLGANR